MSMDKVKSLTNDAITGVLATTDGRRAEVRPMGGSVWVDKELWLATAASSSKVADLAVCPQAEICFMAPDGRNVRIAGLCAVSRDVKDKRLLFQKEPALANYTNGPDDPNFVVLRLRPRRVRLMEPPDLSVVEVDPG